MCITTPGAASAPELEYVGKGIGHCVFWLAHLLPLDLVQVS